MNTKEFVMYGTKKENPSWMEEIITTNRERKDAARAWAVENGYNRIREVEIDLTVVPNFGRTLNI